MAQNGRAPPSQASRSSGRAGSGRSGRAGLPDRLRRRPWAGAHLWDARLNTGLPHSQTSRWGLGSLSS